MRTAVFGTLVVLVSVLSFAAGRAWILGQLSDTREQSPPVRDVLIAQDRRNVCAICRRTIAQDFAAAAGWVAYAPGDPGDDPSPESDSADMSLRCPRCVLGRALVTMGISLEDDAELEQIRNGYVRALSIRARSAVQTVAGPSRDEHDGQVEAPTAVADEHALALARDVLRTA